jgi:hypothetical protein
MRKPLPKHWYFISYGECPVCGHDDTYRERRLGEKPEDADGVTYEYRDAYDGCLL